MKPIAERSTNYGAVGAPGHFDFQRFPPKGFEVVQKRARIGHGRPRYDAAVAALRTWKVQRLSGIEVDIVGTDERIRVAGVTIHAPMRVIAVEDEPTTHVVIIGSLDGHPLAGEERFTVEIAEDETVLLHFRAIVRQEAWWAKLGGPVAKALRRRYHDRFMDVLRSIDVR